MPAMQYNDFYITVCDTIKCTWGDTSWSYLASPRPTHGFLIVLKGCVDYYIDGETVPLLERDFIYLPKGSKYNVRMHIEEGCVTTLLINFNMSGFENFLLEPFQVLHDNTGMLSDVFNKIFSFNHPSFILIRNLRKNKYSRSSLKLKINSFKSIP